MSDVAQFKQVQQAERGWLQERRRQFDLKSDQPEIGLAFSGGGIRSACFHLGFLQALIETKKFQQIDYLSTVSGGGYIGSCLQWLKQHSTSADSDELFSQPVNDGKVIDWLRGHGNYLVDGRGVNSMTLIAALLAGTLFNVMIIVPVLLLIFWLGGFPHAQFYWPAHWHLPGAAVIEGHTGYLLALLISGMSFLGFFLSIPTMALWRRTKQRHNFCARVWMGRLLTLGFVAGGIGLLPLSAQLGDLLVADAESEAWAALAKHLNYLVPFVGGIITLARSKASPTIALMGLTLLVAGLAIFAYHLVFHTALLEHPGYWLWLAGAVMLATFASINRTSMHSFYLDRLCNAFFVRPVDSDELHSGDMPLAALTPANGAPLALINTTCSTESSAVRQRRERMGASFTLSPLFCGNPTTGFASTKSFQSGKLTLGEAMTTSGAAVDPGTAQTASKSLSFLMALLNFRLGFWTRAPGAKPMALGRMPYWLIGCEMFGVGLDESCKNIHLTDGGHFENLGVYELLRREIPTIISGDAGADPTTNMSDLGLLIQRAYADFNCLITIDTSALTTVQGKRHESCFAVGDIAYASGKSGKLYFVKSLLTDAAGTQLASFADTDPSFPNDNTADQFYNEMHFDAYRALGKLNLLTTLDAVGAQIFDNAPKVSTLDTSITEAAL